MRQTRPDDTKYHKKAWRSHVARFALSALGPLAVTLSATGNEGADYHLQMADRSHYNANYAQDFDRCPEHFKEQPHLPAVMQNQLHELCFHGFAIAYSPQTRTPLYGAEHLTAERISGASTLMRTDNFHVEMRIAPHLRAELSDYKSAGFDRGHIAPNADMTDSVSQYDSFSLANIIPQDPHHNRELWRRIEMSTRDLARTHGELYVVTGTVFAQPLLLNAGNVLVPTHLYKALYAPSRDEVAIFFSANTASAQYEIISPQELEKRTGIRLFTDAKGTLAVPDVLGQTSVHKIGMWQFIRQSLGRLWQALG